MHWGAVAAVVAAGLPVHEARAHLEPGDAPRVQIHVAADGTVNATEGQIPRAEPTVLEASTARQVSLVEAQAEARGRPEQVSKEEKEKGADLASSGRFSWDNEHFTEDYKREFVEPDDPRAALVNVLRCFVPHGMFTKNIKCLVLKLQKHKNAALDAKDKDAAMAVIKHANKEEDCPEQLKMGSENCWKPDYDSDFFKKFPAEFEQCLDGDIGFYKKYVRANLEEFMKNPNDYDHNLLNGDGKKPMLAQQSQRQIASAFFHHLLDVHQQFSHSAKKSWGGYNGYEHLLDNVYKADNKKLPFSVNKFQSTFIWAHMNTIMDILGDEGPIGATAIWEQLKMDKKLPPSVAAAKQESAGAAWPALLLALAV